MRETHIESKVCDYAKSKGWMVRKFGGPNAKGDPDRIFFKDGETRFIEFKAPGKKPTKLQAKRLAELQALGFVAVWVDSIEDGKNVFK